MLRKVEHFRDLTDQEIARRVGLISLSSAAIGFLAASAVWWLS